MFHKIRANKIVDHIFTFTKLALFMKDLFTTGLKLPEKLSKRVQVCA